MVSVHHELPAKLSLLRHAESAGNVAREEANRAGAATIELSSRDADIPLSLAGVEQALAIGTWFKTQNPRPNVILASPYKRARDTVAEIAKHSGQSLENIRLDERLRDREFGIVDGLTSIGVKQRYPDIAASLNSLGKFYHRPPGGRELV